jgi:hypothetical protein
MDGKAASIYAAWGMVDLFGNDFREMLIMAGF